MGWFSKKHPEPLYSFRGRARAGSLSAVIVTDVGNVRLNNEDGAVISYPRSELLLKKKGCLFLLADGMGGHNSGEVASDLALREFTGAYYNCSRNIPESLRHALKRANGAVHNASASNPKYSGMGTTFTGVVINEKSLYLAHVGDSRAYLFNRKALVQLSKDHTVVQQLIDMGRITKEEAAAHPDRNILLHALGTQPVIDADVTKPEYDFTENDTLLICSDGLYDLVTAGEMFAILDSEDSIEAIAHTLVSEAKRKGGYDNITVLLVTKKDASFPRLKSTRDVDISLMNETPV